MKTEKMKHIHRFVFAIMIVFGSTISAFGQISKSTVNHAVKVLKGIETDYSKAWAIATLEDAATKDTSAYAMNCLGIIYMAGIGVDADSAKAVSWLENAGANGYADAYHNLGMIFKYSRCGVKQNFEKAYGYYSKGAEKGSVNCLYDKGFMLYKGLGCTQNYSEAIENFRVASTSLHSPALYMLGLCYRNGYGVEKDTAMASNYLHRSAMLGYYDAVEELERPNEETYLHDFYTDNNIPNDMPLISPEVNDTSLIAGSYSGYLAIYDWSGNYVLGEKPMAMTVNKNREKVTGFISLGTDTVSFVADITADDRVVFKDGNLNLYERYTNGGAVKYRMDNMLYDVWNDKICGKLELYSLKQKEPERPMYFELQRNGIQEMPQDKYSHIAITPNPFDNQFNASFELLNDADVQAWIFNAQGVMVWQQNLGHLEKGKQQVTILPSIKSGNYVINIKAGNQILHSLIIKK